MFRGSSVRDFDGSGSRIDAVVFVELVVAIAKIRDEPPSRFVDGC